MCLLFGSSSVSPDGWAGREHGVLADAISFERERRRICPKIPEANSMSMYHMIAMFVLMRRHCALHLEARSLLLLMAQREYNNMSLS